jgi:hypothetical protein
MRAIFLAAAALVIATEAAFSCPDGQHEECVVFCGCVPDSLSLPRPDLILQTTIPGAAVLIEAARQSGNQTLVGAVQNIDAIGAKLDKEINTAISNALTNPAQAVKDAVETHIKAANDIVDAVHASARFVERTVSGYKDVLSNAERRIREGKVVDAIWHLSTDKLSMENENATKFMQESETARQAAQAAANAYGGPAGGAAFAAWMAYNSSGHKVEEALRAGAYTYVVAKGYAQINTMPSGSVDQIAKKAAVTAAVRGIAVAAAGGSKEDILKAAVQGGGAVIVQGGQSFVTKEYLNEAKAKADAFCLDATKVSCDDARQWLKDSRDRLEKYKSLADTLPNTVVTDDGRWAISWDKKLLLDHNSKAPAVVLTYIGDSSPYNQEMLSLAAIGEPSRKFTSPGAWRTDLPAAQGMMTYVQASQNKIVFASRRWSGDFPPTRVQIFSSKTAVLAGDIKAPKGYRYRIAASDRILAVVPWSCCRDGEDDRATLFEQVDDDYVPAGWIRASAAQIVSDLVVTFWDGVLTAHKMERGSPIEQFSHRVCDSPCPLTDPELTQGHSVIAMSSSDKYLFVTLFDRNDKRGATVKVFKVTRARFVMVNEIKNPDPRRGFVFGSDLAANSKFLVVEHKGPVHEAPYEIAADVFAIADGRINWIARAIPSDWQRWRQEDEPMLIAPAGDGVFLLAEDGDVRKFDLRKKIWLPLPDNTKWKTEGWHPVSIANGNRALVVILEKKGTRQARIIPAN